MATYTKNVVEKKKEKKSAVLLKDQLSVLPNLKF